MSEMFMVDSLMRYVGQTVTVFTTSGGLSGSGFTGVLAGVHKGCVRLITDIGAPPACPIGSSCGGYFEDGFVEGAGCGCGGGCRGRGRGCGLGASRRGWGGYNWLGSVAVIPCDKIVSFTHNAI